MPSLRKDKPYLLLACATAVGTFACLCVAFLAIKEGAIGIAFVFTSAVLLFIWPLLVMFIIKYAQGHTSLQWKRDLIATDNDDSPRINFIRL
jgi:Na+/proline symporter